MPKTTDIYLDIYERTMLAGQVLPANVGSFKEMIVVAGLRDMLEIGEEEGKELEYVIQPNAVNWNKEKEGDPQPYSFNKEQLATIGAGFSLLQANGSIPTSKAFIALYEKFEEYVTS